ncbi:MAG: hypothetical protein E7480_05105 [Ruminococcaceae bacterium]|nr:hypothetical protein [Oscillospiraceae bacterium]
MAKVLFDKLAKKNKLNWSADSCGIATFGGSPATENAIEAVKEEGCDLSGHISKPISNELLQEADLVACISKAHMNAVKGYFPEYEDKIIVLGNGISDPYGFSLDTYIETMKEIKQEIENLFETELLK